jgi:hypothetical protein
MGIIINTERVLPSVKIGRYPSNHISIDQSGRITLIGDARYKSTEWISASGLRALPAQPATYVTYGIGGAWEFSDGVTNGSGARIGIPYEMDRSVQPYLRFGWSCPTADPGDNSIKVRWEIEYSYRAVAESMDAAADVTVVDDYVTSTVAKGMVLTDILLVLPSSTDICLGVHFNRIGGHANDNAGAVAHLFGVCLYYTADKLGEQL